MSPKRHLTAALALSILLVGCATQRPHRSTSQFVAPDPNAAAIQKQNDDLARMQSQLSQQQSQMDAQRAEMERLQAEKDALARDLEAQQARQRAAAAAKAAAQDEKYLK